MISYYPELGNIIQSYGFNSKEDIQKYLYKINIINYMDRIITYKNMLKPMIDYIDIYNRLFYKERFYEKHLNFL